jgi:putative NADPH-quinone reductase/1,4-dihydroxy-2-naphthoate octaprenyltransferase
MTGEDMRTDQKKFLVVFSHPKENSLAYAIREAVIKGLKKIRAEVRVQDLYREKFNPLLYDIDENEKDQVTVKMKEDVVWADGIVFIAPLWWAGIPAMLKGYFDRIFTEHFAFQYNQAGIPVGLLKNKKAVLIGTCDTPPLLAKFSKTSLGFKSVIRGVLKLSGIKDSKFILFGSVTNSTEKQREKWIKRAMAIGEKFARPDSLIRKMNKRIFLLIRAIRLPLYSFVFTSILLGSAIGASVAHNFSWRGFGLAIFLGLLCHTAVSYSNEVADEHADKININRTIFNGGTGLMAEGLITKRTLNWGWIITSLLSLFIASLMVLRFNYHWLLFMGIAVGLFLGLQYSFYPLRFSRIGLGEIAAFIGYGVPMMLVGLALQVENPAMSQVTSGFRFFLLSLPISLSVFVTLCLTQIPDTDADKETGKKSISVLFKPKNVMILSATVLFLCIFFCFGLALLDILPLKYSIIISILPLLTGVVIIKNLNTYKIPAGMKMINIMGMSATTTVLCGIVPAVYFFNNAVEVNLLKQLFSN